MTGANIIDAVANPIVIVQDGKVFATSRDVAAFFGKNHRDVLRAIDSLIEDEPALGEGEGGLRSFAHTPYLVEATGQRYRMYTMDRDGFTLLAMGFTGPKALKWKLRYIEAFNAMEKRLRDAPVVDASAMLGDPAALRHILLGYTEKVIALEARVEELTEDSEALDRIARADGSLSITEAAKNLGVRPKDLFDWLKNNGWTYKRPGSAGWLGYQTKCNQGLLEHKSTTVLRGDGTEKITEQVRVTAKGLTTLAKVVKPVVREVCKAS